MKRRNLNASKNSKDMHKEVVKKKSKSPSPKQKTTMKQGKYKSKNFTWFMKVYKGMDDWHIPIFKCAENFTSAKYVLYPGCDKHITASLVFPSVVYVDYNKKVGPIFTDGKVLQWVEENKFYEGETKVEFKCANFDSQIEELASFDLMISACAGTVSRSCSKYIKPNGYFLVSDSHYDARMVTLDKNFLFVGVFDQDGNLDTSEEGKRGHFMTTKGEPLSAAQVEESINKPKTKWSFKLQKQGMFYLFKKLS